MSDKVYINGTYGPKIVKQNLYRTDQKNPRHIEIKERSKKVGVKMHWTHIYILYLNKNLTMYFGLFR